MGAKDTRGRTPRFPAPAGIIQPVRRLRTRPFRPMGSRGRSPLAGLKGWSPFKDGKGRGGGGENQP